MAMTPTAGAHVWRYSGMLPYNNFSGMVWVYPRDRAARLPIFMQEASGGTSYTRHELRTNGKLGLAHGSSGAEGTSVVPLNAWSCIQVKKIGTTMKIYLNAVEEASLTDATAFTKSVERICGEYAQSTPDVSWAGAKFWTADLDEADFLAEMYGYPAVRTSDLHTVSRFLTNTDVDNEVSGGVDWEIDGTLTTNTDTPTFLQAPGSGSALLMMRRRMGALA